MGRVKKAALILLCCVAVVIAALAIWNLSPGPAWMAERTARSYLGRSAPEYDVVQVVECENWQAFPPPFGVKYRSFEAVGKLEEDNYDQYIRLELGWGPFPLAVTEAVERKDGALKVLKP